MNEGEFHRKMAATCFNRAWDLLDKKRRSEREDELMLELAHASCYHWGQVGTPKNRAVGEWQVSRVYCALLQPELALLYAKSCLRTCEENGLDDIMHTADEAMARAYAIARDYRKARRYLERARGRLEAMSLDREDRAVYSKQIRQTDALIRD